MFVVYVEHGECSLIKTVRRDDMDARQSAETSRELRCVMYCLASRGDVLTASSLNDEAHFTDDVECVSVSGSQERNNILNLTFLTCTLFHPIIGLD